MSDQFIAEIRIFPYNFAPTGWATCDGQLLSISQNTALFSLLGTMYGGDGKSNFALPNFQGSVPVHAGQGQGLSDYTQGQSGGEETVTLLDPTMAQHTHSLNASNQSGDDPIPANHTLARYGTTTYQPPPVQNPQQLAFQALPIAGSGFPHNNMMPYLTLNFCIALQGVFPPRS